MGHSMGGLLAADAATDLSNNRGGKANRILGVVAFDTPYLGMHPHVVISGIASLLPKGGDGDSKKKCASVGQMNDHPQVQIVDDEVTDDWEKFKRDTHGTLRIHLDTVVVLTRTSFGLGIQSKCTTSNQPGQSHPAPRPHQPQPQPPATHTAQL